MLRCRYLLLVCLDFAYGVFCHTQISKIFILICVVPQLLNSMFSDVVTVSELAATLLQGPSVVLHVWLCSDGLCFHLL